MYSHNRLIGAHTRLSSVRFGTRIIDSHAHLGKFYHQKNNQWQLANYQTSDTAQIINKTQNPDVQKVLISNLSCISSKIPGTTGIQTFQDEYEGNIALLNECKQDSRFYPLAVCQPHDGPANAQGLSRLLQDPRYQGKFYGLKFHPEHMGLDANHPAYVPYMALASKYKLPCVFHASPGHSDPRKIYETAKKYPQVPVVLYHMSLQPGQFVKDLPAQEIEQRQLGNLLDKHCWEIRERWNQDGIQTVKEALNKGDANLFLEVSWSKPETIVKAIKEVGPDRVLWGSDAPFTEDRNGQQISYQQRVNEVKKAIQKGFPANSFEIIDKVFYRNSEALFFQKRSTTLPKPNTLNSVL
jgi:predicted TIM-barrel fold metal-dependent hydrolase